MRQDAGQIENRRSRSGARLNDVPEQENQQTGSVGTTARRVSLQRVGAVTEQSDDWVAVEEPMEIRLGFMLDGKRTARSVSITMRTPGHDFDLAAGFLFTEGIIGRERQIVKIRHCGPTVGDSRLRNVVVVDLAADVEIDFARLERHFYTTSSCGVCGKTSLDALAPAGAPKPLDDRFQVSAHTIHGLPAKLRRAQEVFERTGGLHAAALFDGDANLLGLREDVGRHNALDKLIGAEFGEGRIPLAGRVLLLSGRASFELLQKALMARISIVAAVGAPSSLAVELAAAYNITLLGFVRDDRFNVYSAAGRIQKSIPVSP